MTYADRLTGESLRALAGGEIAAIWHRGFYPRQVCREVLPLVVEECERARYTLTDDFQSIGTSIGEAAESPANEERYLATAAETTGTIRDRIFAGRLSPLDQLRLMVDELWPAGAVVGKVSGRMMLPGVIRRWPAGGHANPHIDQRDIPLLAEHRLVRRIGVNVYLEVPPAGNGGEVEFWGRYVDERRYEARKRNDYGLDRQALGEPYWSCLPDQGDLLLFDAARVHGVRRVTSGARVSAACFLGVRAPGQPLVLFA